MILPTDGSQYVPRVGDVIPCDDGTLYTITDVSRWDANMFSEGPLPPLPSPTSQGIGSRSIRKWSGSPFEKIFIRI